MRKIILEFIKSSYKTSFGNSCEKLVLVNNININPNIGFIISPDL